MKRWAFGDLGLGWVSFLFLILPALGYAQGKSGEVQRYQESKPQSAPTGFHQTRGKSAPSPHEPGDPCDCIVTLDSVVPSLEGDLLTYCEPSKYNGCQVQAYVPDQKMVEENKQVGDIGTGPIKKVFKRKWLNGTEMTLRVIEVKNGKKGSQD